MQAEQQLGPGWTLMRGGTPKCPEIQDWLASTLPEGARVGIDPFLHTVIPTLTDSNMLLYVQQYLETARSSYYGPLLAGAGVGIDPPSYT